MKYTVKLEVIFTTGKLDAPVKLSQDFIDALIENLNISHETNDMFFDDLQEHLECELVSYYFKQSEEVVKPK